MSARDGQASTAGQPEKSCRGRHQSRNKKPDPFLELSDDALDLDVQPSPNCKHENGTSREDSLFADLVLTPINVISFILSLLLVERQARRWRQSQHAPAHETSFWSQFANAGPEPYQEAKGSTWHPRLSWSRRGIAKAQMESALDLRGRVLLALIMWTSLGLCVVTYAIRTLYGWTFP